MIVGNRVRFRAIEEGDLPVLAQWMNDPDISHSVVGWSFPVTLAGQREWFARSLHDAKNQRWMVETHDGDVIGLTGLWDIDLRNRHALTALKIGAKDVQGKGYGSDAILTLMSYAFFEVGLNRLWGEILPYNVASYKAYVERCGWRVEGVLRQHAYRSGTLHDVLRVGILRDEFVALPNAAPYIPKSESQRVVVQRAHVPTELDWERR